MRIDNVEIYSDTTNAAVLRHPERAYPGILIQGDTLHALCDLARLACKEGDAGTRAKWKESGMQGASGAGRKLSAKLAYLLDEYKRVLGEHEIPLPFVEGEFGR